MCLHACVFVKEKQYRWDSDGCAFVNWMWMFLIFLIINAVIIHVRSLVLRCRWVSWDFASFCCGSASEKPRLDLTLDLITILIWHGNHMGCQPVFDLKCTASTNVYKSPSVKPQLINLSRFQRRPVLTAAVSLPWASSVLLQKNCKLGAIPP